MTLQRGFSLLESIIALALLASVGLALLSWLNGSLISLRRVQDIIMAQVAMHSALDYLGTINPMEQPEGDVELGEWRLRWRVHAVEPPREGAGYPGGVGLFDVGLYDMQVWLKWDERIVQEFVLRQAGYRKVREPQAL